MWATGLPAGPAAGSNQYEERHEDLVEEHPVHPPSFLSGGFTPSGSSDSLVG